MGEAQPQFEDEQPITHQHANGEIFAADSLEAARGMCPILGGMSLEQAGLLLELEAIGKRQTLDQPDQAAKKPVIEKVQKTQPEQGSVKKITTHTVEDRAHVEPLVPVMTDEYAKKPVQSSRNTSAPRHTAEGDLAVIAAQQAEALWRATEARKAEDDRQVVRSKASGPKSNLRLHSEPVRKDLTLNKRGVEMAALHKIPKEIVPRTEHPASLQKERSGESVEITRKPETKKGKDEPSTPLKEEIYAPHEVHESLPQETESTEENALPMAYVFEDDKTTLLTEDSEQNDTKTTGEEEQTTEFVGTDDSVVEQVTQLLEPEASILAAIPELPAPIAEIDVAMAQLAAAIEVEEPQEAEEVESILQEIIALPATYEATADEDIEVLGDKLEELFGQLFEEAGIDYTPELLESFVRLTRAHYLEQLLDATVDAEDNRGLPDEIGTREFLQKLNHGLSAMKHAAVDFYGIGKSILHIYTNGTVTAASREVA